MSWSSHIQTVSNRATKVLNFIKRNLNNCPADTKRTAYLALVRLIMEYSAPVWDLYYNTDIYKLEKVQRRVARWILSDYLRNSVMSLLSSLSILTLQQRCQSSRLTIFYKIINNTLPISIPPHHKRTQFCTRQNHPIILFCHKQPSTPINIVFILELLKTGMSCQLI